MENYYIIYNPPTFNLTALFGKISRPDQILAYLCDKDADAIDGDNYLEYLRFAPRKEKKGMAETLAMECYTLTYIANVIAKCDDRGKVFLADGKRRTLAQIITQSGRKPTAVFITAMSANFASAVATTLALNHGEIPVVIGGIHVSTSPDDVAVYIRPHLPFPELMAQVIGPADSTIMSRILGDLAARRLEATYYGQTSLEDGTWGHANVIPMAPIQLDKLKRIPLLGPLLARKVRVNVAAPYLGCPFSCTFCSISTLPKGQRAFSVRDPVDFIAELKAHQKGGLTAHNRVFFFLPDNLLLGGSKLDDILDQIVSSGLKINFAAQISIDVANHGKLLRKLRRAGATHFFIGLESLDLRNLTYIGKHIVHDIRRQRLTAAEYYRRQLQKIHDAGISVHGSFIFGLPYDYFNTMEDHTGKVVADFCIANHIGLQPSTLTDLPGSINYRESQKEGHYLYGKQGTLDYLVGLCLTDLSEINRVPFDSARNSPLLVAYMAYQAIQRVGATRSAMRNAIFSMGNAVRHPTYSGLTTMRDRLEESLWSLAAQFSVSLYKDHAEMIAYSHNGVKGVFERLYDCEKDKTLRRMFEAFVTEFRE
ncbi:MAG: radical SAM protein [Desulfatitalea sp.]